jgi:radical SAM protein with 4Fe4S-binding SPASM domain
MKRFAKDELGLEFKFDSLINPRIDCSQSPLTVRLSPEDVVALDLHAPETAAEYRQLAERDFQVVPVHSDRFGQVYTCGGGLNSFAIDPCGQMSICVLSHQETYDVRSGSVREGWDHFMSAVRSRERRQRSKCTSCRLRSLCSMCPANGELTHGDAEAPVNFLCEVAHLRAMALGLNVPTHGECEFCPGGIHYEATAFSAERIRSKEVNVLEWSSSATLLPILNNHHSATGVGCGGCGSFR